MIYLTDKRRHLICYPYSIENLHRMAESLGINRCWFHKNHYDIPKRRKDEIESQCYVVNTRMIVDIIKDRDYIYRLDGNQIEEFEVVWGKEKASA